MQYTEVDITLEKIVPFSEIIIAKLDVLKFDTDIIILIRQVATLMIYESFYIFMNYY